MEIYFPGSSLIMRDNFRYRMYLRHRLYKLAFTLTEITSLPNAGIKRLHYPKQSLAPAAFRNQTHVSARVVIYLFLTSPLHG